MAGGIAYSQLRASSTVALAGLESYTDGGLGANAMRVGTGAGLSLGVGGVLVDGSSATFKTPCRFKTQANVDVSTGNSPDAVDSVAVVVGDRILVADQSTPTEDGIYEMTVDGGGSDDNTWVRTADAPTGGEAAGWHIQVLEGTVSADILYRVDAAAGGATIGTDGWTMATGGATRTAGAGLVDGAGQDLDVNVGTGIEIVSDAVRIAAQGNGISGGAGSTLSVLGGTAGADVIAATVSASGVGFDVSAIDGFGITADGSGSLEIDGSASTFKTPCRARTTANVANLVNGAPDTVDGIGLVAGDRVLVADQSTTSQDGIYDVISSALDASEWVRSSDAPTGGEAAGWHIMVLEGTAAGDTLYRVDAAAGGATIGTDGWTMVSSGATRTAGAGLVDGSGQDLDINLESSNPSLQINTDELGIKFAASGGLEKTASGTGINLDTNPGLALSASGLIIDPSDGIGIDANGVRANASTAASAQQFGGLVATRTVNGSAAASAGAGYLAIETDDSTLEVSASNQLKVKAAGITETHLNTSVAGNGLAGGGGTVLSVGAGTGMVVAANDLGINVGSTVDFSSSTPVWTFGNETTAEGLFITGTMVDANHATNKTYVDNIATGLTWLEPVVCIDLIGNRTVAQINGLSPTASDSYVVTDAGTLTTGSLAVVAGDIAEYTGSAWVKIVSQSGGFPPIGTRMILKADGTTLVAPYTDSADRGKIVVYGGASLTGALTTPTQNDAVLVVGNPTDTQPVDDNRAYVNDGGAGASAAWIQFSGGGTTTAGTGATLAGNTLNVNATASVHTNPTLLANADSMEVKYEAAGAGTGGLTDVAAGLRILAEPAGSAAGGLELVAGGLAVLAATAAGIELTASGVAVNLEADGAGAGGLAFDSGEVRISIDATGGANVASCLKLTSTGLSIGVDDVGLEESTAGGVLRIKDLGVTTGKLAANAATIAKINLRFREELFDDTGWTASGGGEFQRTLAAVPLNGTQVDFYNQCLRNGVADMTNQGSGVAATTLDQYRILDDTTGEIRIGADPSSSGHEYLVRYVSLV
jgi:hypothetical protein